MNRTTNRRASLPVTPRLKTTSKKLQKPKSSVSMIDAEIDRLQAEHTRTKLKYEREMRRNVELKKLRDEMMAAAKQDTQIDTLEKDLKRALRLRENEVKYLVDMLNKKKSRNEKLIHKINEARERRSFADITYVNLAKEEAKVARECALLDAKLADKQAEEQTLINRINQLHAKTGNIQDEIRREQEMHEKLIEQEKNDIEREAEHTLQQYDEDVIATIQTPAMGNRDDASAISEWDVDPLRDTDEHTQKSLFKLKGTDAWSAIAAAIIGKSKFSDKKTNDDKADARPLENMEQNEFEKNDQAKDTQTFMTRLENIPQHTTSPKRRQSMLSSPEGEAKRPAMSKHEYFLTEVEECVYQLKLAQRKVAIVNAIMEAAKDEYLEIGNSEDRFESAIAVLDSALPKINAIGNDADANTSMTDGVQTQAINDSRTSLSGLDSEESLLRLTGRMLMQTELQLDNAIAETTDSFEQQLNQIDSEQLDASGNRKPLKNRSSNTTTKSKSAKQANESITKPQPESADNSAPEHSMGLNSRRDEQMSVQSLEEEIRNLKTRIRNSQQEYERLEPILRQLFGYPLFELVKQGISVPPKKINDDSQSSFGQIEPSSVFEIDKEIGTDLTPEVRAKYFTGYTGIESVDGLRTRMQYLEHLVLELKHAETLFMLKSSATIHQDAVQNTRDNHSGYELDLSFETASNYTTERDNLSAYPIED